MVKISGRTQLSKIDLAGIYFQMKLNFSEISKQKAENKLTYHILYFTMPSYSVAIQNFKIRLKLHYIKI